MQGRPTFSSSNPQKSVTTSQKRQRSLPSAGDATHKLRSSFWVGTGFSVLLGPRVSCCHVPGDKAGHSSRRESSPAACEPLALTAVISPAQRCWGTLLRFAGSGSCLINRYMDTVFQLVAVSALFSQGCFSPVVSEVVWLLASLSLEVVKLLPECATGQKHPDLIVASCLLSSASGRY